MGSVFVGQEAVIFSFTSDFLDKFKFLSLPKVNTTKYGLKSWRYFAAKNWNELENDIRIKVRTDEVKKKIRLFKF